MGGSELVSDLLLLEIYFMIRSNMGLCTCISMYVSLICHFCAVRLYESVPMYLIWGLFYVEYINFFFIVSRVCVCVVCQVDVVKILSLVC